MRLGKVYWSGGGPKGDAVISQRGVNTCAQKGLWRKPDHSVTRMFNETTDCSAACASGFQYCTLLLSAGEQGASEASLAEVSRMHAWVLVEQRTWFLLGIIALRFVLAGFWLVKLVKPTASKWAVRLTRWYAALMLLSAFLVLGIIVGLQHAAGRVVNIWDMQMLVGLPMLYSLVLLLLVTGLPILLLLLSGWYRR